MPNVLCQVREKEERIKQFQADLHNTVGLIQEPKKLKDSIKGLYVKYADPTAITAGTDGQGSVDNDIQKEYSRQREHLERSVASLRKKLSKDTEIHRADNVRIMQVGHTINRCFQNYLTVELFELFARFRKT